MKSGHILRPAVLAGAWLLACPPAVAALDELDARRTAAAVELFPRLLALDLDVDRKFNGNQCPLLVVFYHDQASARSYADSLARKVPRLRGHPVVVSTVRVTELAQQGVPPAALLLVERLDPPLFAAVRDYSREHHRLLFSPFPGDVERGASAGLYIGARILLLFNVHELKYSSIRIEPEVLRISKLHD